MSQSRSSHKPFLPPTCPSVPSGWATKLSRKGKLYFFNTSKKVSFRSLPEVLAFEKALVQQNKKPNSSCGANTPDKRPSAEATCRKGSVKPFTIRHTRTNCPEVKTHKTVNSTESERREILDVVSVKKQKLSVNTRGSERKDTRGHSTTAPVTAGRWHRSNLPDVCPAEITASAAPSRVTGAVVSGISRAGCSLTRRQHGAIRECNSKQHTDPRPPVSLTAQRGELPQHYRIPKRTIAAQPGVTSTPREQIISTQAATTTQPRSRAVCTAVSKQREKCGATSTQEVLKCHVSGAAASLSTNNSSASSDTHLNSLKKKRKKGREVFEPYSINRKQSAQLSRRSHDVQTLTSHPATASRLSSREESDWRTRPGSAVALATSSGNGSAQSSISQLSETGQNPLGQISQPLRIDTTISTDADPEAADSLMEWESKVFHNPEEIVCQVTDWRSLSGAEVSFSDTSLPAAPQSASISADSSQQCLHLVIDTNVLIKSVDFVAELRYTVLEGLCPVLMIPWVVLQELDKLKTSTRHIHARSGTGSSPSDHQAANRVSTVGASARRAVSFLLSCLQSADQHVRGQTVDEARAADGLFDSRHPDDAVLKCCLWLSGRCCLITEDKNLAAKALVHRISAYNSCELVSRYSLCDIREPLPMRDDAHTTHAVRLILRCLLSHIVVREMTRFYGNDWGVLQLTASCPPPPLWTSCALVSALHRLRASVFCRVFGNDWSRWAALLNKTADYVWSESTVSWVVSMLSRLLGRLQPCADYSDVSECLSGVLVRGRALSSQAIAVLLPSVSRLARLDASRCKQTVVDTGDQRYEKHIDSSRISAVAALSAPSSSALSSDQLMVDRVQQCQEPDQCLLLFQQMWSYLHTCCGVLLDVASLPHDRQYSPPSPFPNLPDCQRFAPRISPLVSTLMRSLFRLLEVSVVSMHESSHVLLLSLEALNAVIVMSGQTERITGSLLIGFIKKPANRLLLGEAIKQLNSIESDLLRANAALTSTQSSSS